MKINPRAIFAQNVHFSGERVAFFPGLKQVCVWSNMGPALSPTGGIPTVHTFQYSKMTILTFVETREFPPSSSRQRFNG